MICVFEDGPLQGHILEYPEHQQEICYVELDGPPIVPLGTPLKFKDIIYKCYGYEYLNGEKVKVFDVYTTKQE
jgi:hypothetical protein